MFIQKLHLAGHLPRWNPTRSQLPWRVPSIEPANAYLIRANNSSRAIARSLRLRWSSVPYDVKGAGRARKPAGVMHWSEGCRAIALIGVVGDAVEGLDMGSVVIPMHWAGAGGERRHRNVCVCRHLNHG